MKPKPSPFKIETGVPMPFGNRAASGTYFELAQCIKRLKTSSGEPKDESFLWHENRQVYRAAKHHGMKIKSRKENGVGYRVWRIK